MIRGIKNHKNCPRED